MKKYHFLLTFCLSWLLLLISNHSTVLANTEINEESLFGDSEALISDENIVNENAAQELEAKRIGFSGAIKADSTYTRVNPDMVEPADKDQVSNTINADFFFDIRLTDGVKGFLNLGLYYYPEGKNEKNTIQLPDELLKELLPKKTEEERAKLAEININNTIYTDFVIKEFFVDTNWQNKVYFRTGKQVLKWGRSYFWNPTDLINVEKKDFFDMDRNRAGTYGIKAHLPFGVKQNIYLFAGMNEAATLNDLTFSGKYEFLLGKTEMSLSTWLKRNAKPVYGFDFSSRFLDLDWRGELSLCHGGNAPRLAYNSLTPIKTDQWLTKASLGCTKNYDHGDINDRISLTGEFYYNQAGYEQNIFEKITTTNTKLTYLLNYYEPYANSKYYFAFFGSVQKFIISDLTLNLNAIANLIDKSVVATSGISYQPALKDYSIDLSLNGYFGSENTEARLFGNSYSISLGTSITF